MSNENIKLLIEVANPANNRVQFTLYKGAQLDASVISPKQLIEMHNGVYDEPTLEEKVQNQVLKNVMGECTQDIIGKCSIEQAVKLIRALKHTQNAKVSL